MKKIFTPLNVFGFLIAVMWGLIIFDQFQPYQPQDDSDGPNYNSHMNVFTDYLTGCQYLYRYSLTPRMGADGKQVCIRIGK